MESNTINIKPKEKNRIRMILVIIFLLIFSIITFGDIRAEYLYNLELGQQYVEKYIQDLKYNSIIFLGNFIVLFIIFYIVTFFIKKGLKAFFIEEKVKMPKLPNKSLSLIISAILTLFIVPNISSDLILALNSASFAIDEEIFNFDISYYVFKQPVIEMMLKYIIFIGVISIIYGAIYYITSLNIYFNGVSPETLKKNIVLKLLIVIFFIIVLAISALVFIKSSDVLFGKFLSLDNGIELVGAGSTDILIKVWGYRLLSIVIIVSSILIINYILKGEKKKAFKAVLIVPMYIVILFLLMIGYQYIFVNPSKLDKEYQYIKYNIESTKNAYNIRIQENELPYSGTVTYEEVQNNTDILQNIPIVDESTTLITLEEYQNKYGYYTFDQTQILEYNNELVYITPRDIINSKFTSRNNKTYEYTHGFGTIITSATRVDENGGIVYLESDFDNNSQEFINITEPRIYFGTSSDNVIVINSNTKKEFDYPISSTDVVNNSYSGNAGLKLGFIDRLILAIKEKNMNILFASGLNEESKILLNRNILNRVKIILPELIYDENPYLVIDNNGKLVWVIDAYTVSNKYPYSTSTIINVEGNKQEINYIRNSVKVLVDAYDGTVSYYITDRNDPIIMAYRNIYPTIFNDLDQGLPDSIKDYIVYPEFLYDIQSKMINIYHNVQPEVLYRNDDIWEIANYKYLSTSSKTTQMSANYTKVDIVNNEGIEENMLGLVIAYTLEGKQNLNSYLIGVYDKNTNENKLILNKFTSNSGILGPKQLERQIEEDVEISKQLEDISLAGSKIIKNLYIIPIENTIIYVEPIYQVLVNESPVPILKKIIVSSGNKLAMGNTLEEALENLLSQEAVDIEIDNSDDIEAIIESIIKTNDNLTSSSKSNNWELIGQDIERLQSLIEKLELLKEEDDKAKNEIENNITENTIVTNY